MPADRSHPVDVSFPTETANDRLKQRATLWQSNAIVVAVAVHFAVLALWPEMSAGVPGRPVSESEILIMPEVDVPEAPKQIARPAAPVIVSDVADPAVTIPGLRDWNNPGLITPPPAAAAGADRDKFREFVPSMVPPRVLNQQEVERALVRHYPPLLRDAGIGGDVSVLLWLDEKGTIVRAEIGGSSGREPLDQAALEVVKVMRLEPAYNMNQPTRVIVSLPIRFIAR